ncbi:MAG: hypothetical protein DRP83_01815 [Planctomycetota bacterium]|nr:MAG: hypothetical protein DRP83_01815 [Planctomycetota bacterium]
MTNSIKRIVPCSILAIIIVAILASCACNTQAAGRPKSIKTFSDMLEYSGIKDPNERKYIEDELKQQLQDEISDIVDTKLDVVDYIQVLNHLAYGETKKANNYLAEKVLTKLLENAIGGPAMKLLTAAWDFDKYVWDSVQKWADKRDKDLFNKFLIARVKDWRQGKGLYEMETAGRLQAFGLWWQSHENGIGRIKIYGKGEGNRDDYKKKFKDACINAFASVANKEKAALEAREALQLAMRHKLSNINIKIFNRRRNYKNILRAFKRANVKPTRKLIRKYQSDRTYRDHLSKLAAENRKSSLEHDGQILQNADADIDTASQAATRAKNVSEKKSFAIVPLPLGAFNTFVRDYKTLMGLIFAGAVDQMEARRAVNNWHGKVRAFGGRVSAVKNSYYKMGFNGELTDSQKKRLHAERIRIDKALRTFNKIIEDEKTRRRQEAISNIKSLRSYVEKLEKLQETPLEKILPQDTWKWQEQIRREMDSICNKAGKDPGARAYLRGILNQPNPNYSHGLVGGAISQSAADPLDGMAIVSDCYEDCVDAYKKGLAALQSDINRRISANDSLLARRVDALIALENAYKPFDAQTVLLGFGTDEIDFKYSPTRWYSGFTQENKLVLRHLKRFHLHLSAMLGVQVDMRLDFDREKSLLGQAQSLLSNAMTLASRYAKKTRDDPETPPNIVIALLRSDKQAVFSQMISRNRTIMRRLNGRAASYQNVLRPATIKAYRLDKAPFEGNRRYPNQYAEIIKGMEDAIDDASQAEAKDKRHVPILKRCDEILKQLHDVGAKTRLLSKLVGEVINQAEKKIRLVQNALAPQRHPIIRDIDAAKQVLDSFKNFAAQVAANYAADNRTMRRYLNQAKGMMSARASAASLQRAGELLGLATQHTQVMKYYALYKGSWRFDAEIRKLKQKLGSLGSGGGDIDDEPMKFIKGGIFAVSLNDTDSGQRSQRIIHEIAAEDGKLTIRSKSYSRVFKNAKQVMLRVWAGPRVPEKFVTVATNRAEFTYPTKIVFNRVYTLELRVITASGVGYVPRPFPLRFRWSRKKTEIVDGVKIFRIRRKGQVVKLTAPLGATMALKFTTGIATDKPELFVIGTADKPFAGIPRYREMAMANSRWMDINQYSRWGGRSKKFAHYSTEEDDRQRIRYWEFAAYINPNEQYNVYRQTIKGWKLVAHVIGMNVGKPKTPTSNSTGSGHGHDDDDDGKNFSNALGLPLAGDRKFVISLSHSILHHDPNSREVKTWLRGLSRSRRANIIYAIFGCPAYTRRNTTSRQFVRDAYQSILGREPRPAESNYWTRHLEKSRAMRRTVIHSLLQSKEYKSLEAKRTGKGNRRDKDKDHDDDNDDKDHDDGKERDNKAGAKKAYQEYIAAYNKLTQLMAAGKGDTPAAQRAYKQYKIAKKRYEALSK